MDLALVCGIIIALNLIALGDGSRSFYSVMRLAMPLLAAVMFVQLVQRDGPALLLGLVALSGLVFIPGDRLPRIVWLPINLAVVGLYAVYAGSLGALALSELFL